MALYELVTDPCRRIKTPADIIEGLYQKHIDEAMDEFVSKVIHFTGFYLNEPLDGDDTELLAKTLLIKLDKVFGND